MKETACGILATASNRLAVAMGSVSTPAGIGISNSITDSTLSGSWSSTSSFTPEHERR